MKKQFLLILILLSLPLTSAFAASVIMEGNYVRTAISDNGTLGYGSSTSPGLLHDPDGTGTFGIDDYLTPGTPWEMFSVSSEETGLLTNNNTSTSTGDISGSIEPGATTSSVTWSGTYDVYFTITHEYTLATDSERIDIVTTITALSNLTDLEFARAIDPDPDVRTYGSYYTVNGRGYDANSDGDFDDASDIAPEDWVHSEGTNTGLTLGLFSDSDITHNVGVSSPWSTDPAEYLAGTDDGNGDYAIGIGFDIGDLISGESVTLTYAYVMGDSIDTVDIPGDDDDFDPVPEPTTMVLFGLGVLGMAGVTRRKS